jgi:hypothetical protein
VQVHEKVKVESRATIQNSFNQLIKYPPHKDITAINKFITSSCFTRTGKDVLILSVKWDTESNHFVVDEYIKSGKKQFEEAQNKFGDEFDIEFFVMLPERSCSRISFLLIPKVIHMKNW